MTREVELDEADLDILESLLTDDNVEELLDEFTEAKIRSFMDKVGFEFPEELLEDEEDDEDDPRPIVDEED